jgi:hypothetical protein
MKAYCLSGVGVDAVYLTYLWYCCCDHGMLSSDETSITVQENEVIATVAIIEDRSVGGLEACLHRLLNKILGMC